MEEAARGQNGLHVGNGECGEIIGSRLGIQGMIRYEWKSGVTAKTQGLWAEVSVTEKELGKKTRTFKGNGCEDLLDRMMEKVFCISL